MPRGACAELIALHCCAVCLLMSRSERQYVRYLRAGGGGHGDRETINWRKQEDEYTKHVHKPGICIIPGTTTTSSNCCRMFKRTHSAARHSTAKRRARHGAALRCAAELYVALLN